MSYSREDKGRVLYEIYARHCRGVNFQGDPLPTFVDLPEDRKAAWQSAAETYEVVMFGCNA